MARRTALTHEALMALGADKLARLVLEEAAVQASFKTLVLAALAGTRGPKAVAAIVERRLAGLERARGLVDWDRRKAFAADLGATLTAITDELGPIDPGGASDCLVRFLTCAGSVFERVDDSSGSIQRVFHEAADALPTLAAGMGDDGKVGLVERLIALLAGDENGLIEAVVHGMVPLLPPTGLAEIDARLTMAGAASDPSSGNKRAEWERLGRRDRLIRARQAVADARGDVDGFIALASARPDGRQDSMAIAERLFAAARLVEALDWVRRPAGPGLRAMTVADLADSSDGMDLLDRQRVLLEIRILMALGRKDEAQDLRWQTFEAALDGDILRDYVAHLGDFEEFDALERAFACARTHPHRYRALGFFLAWPRLDLAARLVLDHRDSWAGQHYGMLLPAAEALEPDHPVAATVLYRALLDDILARARLPAYGHGARYFAKLDALGTDGHAAAGLTDHESYRAALRRSHGRKSGFWSIVEGAA